MLYFAAAWIGAVLVGRLKEMYISGGENVYKIQKHRLLEGGG